jgi:hypothetical protein
MIFEPIWDVVKRAMPELGYSVEWTFPIYKLDANGCNPRPLRPPVMVEAGDLMLLEGRMVRVTSVDRIHDEFRINYTPV